MRGRDWHVGVIGLAAGRLCQQYYCPTCVLSEHEGLLHGSLRSIPGVHIHECLKTCDDLLLRYGGQSITAVPDTEADYIVTVDGDRGSTRLRVWCSGPEIICQLEEGIAWTALGSSEALEAIIG